jgi:hypothetical protein
MFNKKDIFRQVCFLPHLTDTLIKYHVSQRCSLVKAVFDGYSIGSLNHNQLLNYPDPFMKCDIYGFINICFNNIRYGLVARISRSHTVLSKEQLGPRRPGFNSPCRKTFSCSLLMFSIIQNVLFCFPLSSLCTLFFLAVLTD